MLILLLIMSEPRTSQASGSQTQVTIKPHCDQRCWGLVGGPGLAAQFRGPAAENGSGMAWWTKHSPPFCISASLPHHHSLAL